MPTQSLLSSFADHVRHDAESPALVWEGRTISYRVLDELTRDTAARLAEDGVSAADTVCVVGRKSPETIATLLACFASGLRVLLPPSDLGEAALAALCEQAACRFVITAETGSAVRRLMPKDAEPVHSAVPVGAPGLMLTTSGSTGSPKIVPLSADGVDAFLAWAADQFGIDGDSAVLNYAPLNFDLCLLDVWTTLARGGRVVLVGEDVATLGDRLLELVAGSTVVQAVPMLFRLLTDAADRLGAPPLETVRQIVVTGDVLAAETFARMRTLFPHATVHNLYGCTETNDSLLHRVDDGVLELDGPLPVGRPIAGVTTALLDSDGAVVDGAGTGELLVRTPFQADGYLDARLDQGRFVPAPQGLPEGTYYRTGDLVSRDGTGLFTLVGRADFHVKVRGVRINTQEVEAVLDAHRDVSEAAVIALPDELAGHRLHAVVRRNSGTSLNGLDVRGHCAARLVRTAIPGVVDIVDEPLPRTSTGKLDRNQIRRSLLRSRP
jgi:acyl-coenzyme A synthetase/AMP-(fatty) acid ligase